MNYRIIENIVEWIRGMLVYKQKLSTYVNYQVAAQHVGNYEDPDIVRMVTEKTKIFLESPSEDTPDQLTQANIEVLESVWKQQGGARPLGIIDIGGACGAWFIHLDRYIPHTIGTWCVVETPAFVEMGQQYFQHERLKFFLDIENAQAKLPETDIVFAQGVLQYLEYPLLVLEDIFRTDADFVYLTRTVVSDNISEPIITIHETSLVDHGPGAPPEGMQDKQVTTPITIYPLDQLMSEVERLGSLVSSATTQFDEWQINDEKVNLLNLTVLAKVNR